MNGIDRWLEQLGLGRYAAVFAANDIDIDVLRDLTEPDLEKLGLSLGHRKRLLKAVAALPAVAGIASAPESPARPAEAERRQLTVMFCDLVGSTELSRRLDPEDLREVIRAYQECCGAVVAEFDGHVAKFLGDGVLVYFGYPRAHEDDAERAVRTGLRLVHAIAAIPTRFGLELQARIGIATGSVVVGDLIGVGAAREEAVVGETPSLAARLQTLAEPGTVVIAAGTRRLLGGLFDCRDLGGRRLKGFDEPVPAWQVIGEARTESRFEALHGAVLTPLVGREHSLALLLERWERAKDGEGQVVLVSGEPGIGKSRIAQSLRERLGNEPCTSLRYGCSPYHQSSALYPFIVQLEREAELSRDDPPDAQQEKLERLLAPWAGEAREAAPLLAALLSMPAGDRYPSLNLTAQRQKERTLAMLADRLERLAARLPVLMTVEDAHWMDPTSLELLELVVHRAKDLPVLLIITSRPEFVPSWAGLGQVSSLVLDRLSRRQSADLAARIAGDQALAPELLGHIVARAEGVPLFVEELTRAILESGPLSGEGVGDARADPMPPAAVPSTLHDSLMARLDRVPAAKAVAQIGAVIGREFSYEVLAAVASLPEPTLREALRQLVDSQLVFCRGAIPDATFSFKHALVQDIAYESLLRSRRQQLHAGTAAVLEERFPGLAEWQPELLAHHFTQAAMSDKAADYWQKAGRRAADRSAHLEAIEHLKKAERMARSLPAGSEQARRELSILLAMGVSVQDVEGAGSPETEKLYLRARELSARTGSAAERFAAMWGLWRLHATRRESEPAHALAGELLRIAQEEQDPALLLQAYHALWSTYYGTGDQKAILDYVDAGMALYDASRRHSEIYLLSGHDAAVCGLGSRAHATWLLGFPGQGAKALDHALALARKLEHPSSLGLALSNAVELYLLVRSPDRLRIVGEELIAVATEQGFAVHLAIATFGLGWALAAQGRSEDGIEQMRKGLAGMRATQRKAGELYHLALLAEACCRSGNVDDAQSIFRIELAAADTLDAGQNRGAEGGEVHRLSGEVLLAHSPSDAAKAESCFRLAMDIARRQDARTFELRAAVSLGRLWRDQGRAAEARELLAPIYAWFTEGFDTPDLVEARALLDSLA